MNLFHPSQVILISSTGLYPYHKDAPARLFKSIGEELADLGVSVTFVCLSPYKRNPPPQSVKWNEVFDDSLVNVWHREKKRNFFSRRWQEITACICALKRSKRGSLFLFNSAPYSFFSLLVVLGKFLGIRTVYIAHGGIFTENAASFTNQIMRLNLKIISFALEEIITVSQALAEHVKQFFPNIPIQAIHNSLGCLQGSPSPYASKNASEHTFSIFYMGRLEKVKGLDTLLSAFQLLYRKHKECRLIIAGNGQEGKKLQDLAKDSGIANAVSFVGFINKKEKEKYFNEADIFTLPSTYETFGMVILEAMCFKVPVIASRVGGIPEVIHDGETGILFESGNKDDLFQKIEALYLDKPKREKIAQAAYLRLKEEFSTSRMGAEYFELVKKLTTEFIPETIKSL
ncbi:MAG: glycosyltransferase family 4 protein [Anaerolineaceae bacterium]